MDIHIMEYSDGKENESYTWSIFKGNMHVLEQYEFFESESYFREKESLYMH